MMAAMRQAFSVDLRVRLEETAGRLPAGVDNVPGVVYERDDVRVTAILVDHRAMAPAYGYRIDYLGRSVVLSGDTQVSAELIEAAGGADLLIHEVFEASDDLLRQNPQIGVVRTFHVDGQEAGEVFRQVRPRLAVFSHIILAGVDIAELIRRTRMVYSGPLEVGEDLMRIVVGDEVSVHRP